MEIFSLHVFLTCVQTCAGLGFQRVVLVHERRRFMAEFSKLSWVEHLADESEAGTAACYGRNTSGLGLDHGAPKIAFNWCVDNASFVIIFFIINTDTAGTEMKGFPTTVDWVQEWEINFDFQITSFASAFDIGVLFNLAWCREGWQQTDLLCPGIVFCVTETMNGAAFQDHWSRSTTISSCCHNRKLLSKFSCSDANLVLPDLSGGNGVLPLAQETRKHVKNQEQRDRSWSVWQLQCLKAQEAGRFAVVFV